MRLNTPLSPPNLIQEGGGTITLRWAWWIHPAAPLLLVTGLTATLTYLAPSSVFEEWSEPKFFNGSAFSLTVAAIALMLAGTLIFSTRANRNGTTSIVFQKRQISWLTSAYRILLLLTLLGYVFWFANAIRNNVGAESLQAVIDRDPGAISALKAEIRPVAGVTTLTQFGPPAVIVGRLLTKLGSRKPGVWLVVLLAAVRTLFYAERLALIEVVVPLAVLGALTASGRRQWLVRLGPIVAAPALWLVFALSEYTRSWVYYQQFTDLPFPKWVSIRLLGYYATSFNNSALLADVRPTEGASPYFSLSALWDAPGMHTLLGAPLVRGLAPTDWWATVLARYSNPEFNNTGSFLVTYAELGTLGLLVYWLIVGLACGAVYSGVTRGSVPSLIAYCALLIGILELPRLLYWGSGRAFPVVLACIAIAAFFPRHDDEDYPAANGPLQRTRRQ